MISPDRKFLSIHLFFLVSLSVTPVGQMKSKELIAFPFENSYLSDLKRRSPALLKQKRNPMMLLLLQSTGKLPNVSKPSRTLHHG